MLWVKERKSEGYSKIMIYNFFIGVFIDSILSSFVCFVFLLEVRNCIVETPWTHWVDIHMIYKSTTTHKMSCLHTHTTPFAPLPVVAVSCRKQDGGQADVEECLKFASSMPPLTQPCQLPCQEDCQLSSWSKFSPCTADCVGVRTRKRMLVGEWQTLTSRLHQPLQ